MSRNRRHSLVSDAATLRLTSLQWQPYALPFKTPFQTASGTLQDRRGFLLRIKAEDGPQAYTGVGEAAPLPDFGGEDLLACELTLRHFAATLIGKTFPAQFTTAEQQPAMGLVPGPSIDAAPCAVHALEGALLDVLAQREGCSLATWLHPDAATAVPVNATLGAGTLDATIKAARQAVQSGYRILKLKVATGDDGADTARLVAVREAVGPDIGIRIDANGAWTPHQALQLLTHWAPLKLEYVEQPLPAHDLNGMRTLKTRSPIPIAADESIRNPGDAERILTADAAAVLVLKPMLLGGPLSAMRIAREATKAGVPVVLTTVLEGIYGRLTALHTAAAVGALHRDAGLMAPACGLATGNLLQYDLVDTIPRPEGGTWQVPRHPGLGLG